MWWIDKDIIDGTNKEIHSWPSPEHTLENKANCVHRFRLLDDDDEIYFYGWSSNSSSFAPLDEWGVSYGCTSIEYMENDKWEVL